MTLRRANNQASNSNHQPSVSTSHSSQNARKDALPPKLDLTAAFQGKRELDFVFPGLLAGGMGMIAAPGGSGKSYLLLAMAASVAIGEPFLPSWPRNGPQRAIVYLAEDSPEVVHNRVHYLSRLFKAEQQALLLQNLEIRSLVGVIPTLVEERYGEVSRTTLASDIAENAKGARLLVLDPIRRFHSGDENDSAQATRLVQVLEGIARQTVTCAIVFSHHTAKGASLNGQGDAQQAARGSSALTDGVRWQANMVGMSDDEVKKYGVAHGNRKKWVRMALSKANYAESSNDVWFERMEGGVLKPGNPSDLDFGIDSTASFSQKKGGRKNG